MATPGDTRDTAGFRLRGLQPSRLDTFIDAAFAFSLTLLVISYNQLPDSVAELREALRRVPTFVVCFVLLAMFWAAHHRWSRRFGLRDGWTTVLGLSLVLVLVLLVYVYPLRMVISSFLSLLSAGALPSELGLRGDRPLQDAQAAFVIYGAGFGLLSGIVLALNVHALRQAGALALDPRELHQLRTEIGVHAIMVGIATASVLCSVLVLWFAGTTTRPMAALAGLPMWVYAALAIVIPAYAVRRDRALGRLDAPPPARGDIA